MARHAAACGTCEAAIRRLETLRQTLVETVRADVATLDLSGVWPRLSSEVHRVRGRRAWQRRARTIPMWGTFLALAASAVFWLRVPSQEPVPSRPAVARVTSRTPQNLAYINRLAGKDVSIRRDPKAGTTLIWVNYTAGDGSR